MLKHGSNKTTEFSSQNEEIVVNHILRLVVKEHILLLIEWFTGKL